MHSAAAPAHTGVVSVGRSALGTANRAGTPAGASASFRTASRGRCGPGVCSHRSSSAPSPRNICPNAIGRSHKLISNRGLCELRPFVHEGPYFIGHRLGKLIDLQNLFGGLSPACDFVDLVQPGNYLVTAFPAQNGFCTRPVAHQGHDLAGLGPRYRARLSAVRARRPLCLDIGSIHQTGSQLFKIRATHNVKKGNDWRDEP